MDVRVQQVLIPAYLPEFTLACHRTSPDSEVSSENILEKIGEGRTLGQCMEIVRFGVRVSFCSRIFTHQLVRARIGLSFSQQCTGDVDSRHADVIVPNCYSRGASPHFDRHFIKDALTAKLLYCEMVDEGGISIQEARYCLPAGLTSFIYMDICLGALAALYTKRSCVMTQTWEMVKFAEKLRLEVADKARWALPLFHSDAAKSWWMKTKDTPFANTHLWAPSGDYDTFEWNPDSFVHGELTHEEVSSGPVMDTVYGVGSTISTFEQWRSRADLYQI